MISFQSLIGIQIGWNLSDEDRLEFFGVSIPDRDSDWLKPGVPPVIIPSGKFQSLIGIQIGWNRETGEVPPNPQFQSLIGIQIGWNLKPQVQSL